jgi:hypothetical protein
VAGFAFAVPKASTQESISAEGAYFVYGFGAQSQLDPWTDPAYIFQRSATSGTQSLLAAAIHVPPDKWKGTGTTGSSDLLTKMTSTDNAEKTIGILGTDVTDTNRLLVKVLAYQNYDQGCAYYPDTDDQSFDKINIRDGHYPLWGPVHMLSHVNAGGFPLSAGARTLVNIFTGTAVITGLDLVALAASLRLIPQCAMRVSRAEEVGPLASFAPNKSCGCYFEKVAAGSTQCSACTTDTDCSGETPSCNFGYCEVQ